MAELKEIVSYKRKEDVWICSECETENPMVVGSCVLCRHVRNNYDIIQRKWVEKTKTTDKKTIQPSPVPYREEEDFTLVDNPVKEKNNFLYGVIIALLLILILTVIIKIGGSLK